MVSIEELAKINNLVNSCDELVSGKFILSEYKIAKILKDIGESKEIYKLLAECMQNFNFEREFSRAQISLPRRNFIIPEEPEKILPFVFCLLMEINNKKINLNSFLNEFYSNEDGVDSFTKFAQSVVKPFRDIIYSLYLSKDKPEALNDEMEENYIKQTTNNKTDNDKKEEESSMQQNNEEKDDEESISKDEMEKFYLDCKTICNEILSELKYEKRKEYVDDARYVVETMIIACNESNFRTLSALIISFGAMSESLKSIRFLSRELKNILISFFA